MGRTARRQLRAYVSGGLGRYEEMPVGHLLYVTINNYGTTPAFIGTVCATLMDESELPPMPREEDPGEYMGYVLPPVHDIDKSYPSKRSVWWDGKPGKVVYGRIYYRDIFEKCRSSGFLLRRFAAELRSPLTGRRAGYPRPLTVHECGGTVPAKSRDPTRQEDYQQQCSRSFLNGLSCELFDCPTELTSLGRID